MRKLKLILSQSLSSAKAVARFAFEDADMSDCTDEEFEFTESESESSEGETSSSDEEISEKLSSTQNATSNSSPTAEKSPPSKKSKSTTSVTVSIPAPVQEPVGDKGRGRGRGRGARIRGGISVKGKGRGFRTRGGTNNVNNVEDTIDLVINNDNPAVTSGKKKKDEDPNNGWERLEDTPFFPLVPKFVGTPGPRIRLPQSVLAFVHLFLTEELIGDICYQTNLYASQYKESVVTKPHSRVNEWKPVEPDEIIFYFALTIMMGLYKKPAVSDYWSTDPLFHSPIYGLIMSCNRYQLISRFLHINDNQVLDPKDPKRDKLHKVRPFIQYLV